MCHFLTFNKEISYQNSIWGKSFDCLPWTEEPGGLQSMESQRVNTTAQLTRTEHTIMKQRTLLHIVYLGQKQDKN